MTELSRESLERARDLGAVTYLSAYVHLMGVHLEIADPTHEAFNAMATSMISPLNHATEAIWRALMKDEGYEAAVEKFKAELEQLAKDPIE